MLAAKLISSSDVFYVIPRRNWVDNTTYDMYEHDISSSNPTTSGATNLYEGTFYFMTSEYKVYKVLDNNGGTNIVEKNQQAQETFLLNLVGILYNICTH